MPTTTPKTEDRYTEAVGRRKTSTARVRIMEAAKARFVINSKEAREYLQTEFDRQTVLDPIMKGLPSGTGTKWSVEALVEGGGAHSQAEAIRHGLARALVLRDPSLRGAMKALGYLKRDPRAKERRKFGLKKARKSPQWSKR